MSFPTLNSQNPFVSSCDQKFDIYLSNDTQSLSMIDIDIDTDTPRDKHLGY